MVCLSIVTVNGAAYDVNGSGRGPAVTHCHMPLGDTPLPVVRTATPPRTIYSDFERFR